jgi:hypothetical protein
MTGRDKIAKTFDQVGYPYNRAFVLKSNIIFESTFKELFLTKFLYTLALVNDQNKQFFKFKEHIDETFTDKKQINRGVINKIKREFFKSLEIEKSVFEKKTTGKACIVHKNANSLVSFVTSAKKYETSYLNLPNRFLSALSHKTSTTAAKWLNYINELDLIKKTPVYYVFNESYDSTSQKYLLQEFPQLYNRVFFKNKKTYLRMPNKLEFLPINSIDTKIIKIRSKRKN